MSSLQCRTAGSDARYVAPSARTRSPILGRLRGWVEARRSLKELLALDDRALHDIGLTRSALARHYRRRNFWW